MEKKYKKLIFIKDFPVLWEKTQEFLTPRRENALASERTHWGLESVQIQVVNIHWLGKVIFLFGWVQDTDIILKFGLFKKKSSCFEEAKATLKIGCLATVSATPEADLNDLVFVIEKCKLDSLYDGFFVPWNPSDYIVKSEVLCKYWIRQSTRSGKFFEGIPQCCKNCEYRHEPTDAEKVKVLDLIRHRREVLAREKDKRDCAHGDKSSKAARARMFVQWLLEIFDKEHLQKTGVLDVAGGKGGVAHLLALEGIPVTVVDPREKKKLNKKMRKHLRKRSAKPHEHLETLFDQDFTHNHPDLTKSVSLVVGMHPDEATHAIVDLSIELGKDLAVVPCCVFPKMFPRFLKNNTPVKDYSDLLTYFQEKYPFLLVHFLPFQGRNRVLYYKAGKVEQPPSKKRKIEKT